jgi:hypothetical protein
MDSKNLNHLIKKSLETFDIKNKKYSKYINNENVTFDRDNIKIKFDDFNDTFNYQVLGSFLPYNNVWLWSWVVPQNTSKEIIMTRKLLEYGLKQSYDNPNIVDDEKDHPISYLKVQLVNSRFIIDKKFQMDIHLSICSFLLKDNILFIFKKKRYLTKDTFITNYFLIYKD